MNQLSPPERYIAATRKGLFCFAVIPVLFVSALLSLPFRLLFQIGGQLLVLALLGAIFVEASLVRFHKVPFACSYLPGKVNMQAVFWGGLTLLMVLAATTATLELQWLKDIFHLTCLVLFLLCGIASLRVVHLYRVRRALLQYEELEPDIVTSLRISLVPSAAIQAANSEI